MVQLLPDHYDPLTSAIAPSKDETPEQRAARLKTEEQAKKLSDDIDKFLKYGDNMQESNRKKAMAVKILLLGQSECGKSTALKNFQLLYSPQTFQAERAAWRMVILFNLVQSIRILHTIISDAMQAQQQLLLEEAEQFVKSPTSSIFGARSPGHIDFQDLFPQQQQQQQQQGGLQGQIHRKRSSGPEWTNGNGLHASISDNDQTDAMSTNSAATSSSSTKNAQPQRRSSLFGPSGSKEGKGSKESKGKSRSRPATSTPTTNPGAPGTTFSPSLSPISVSTPTTTTNAFCFPTQSFGSVRKASPPSKGSEPVNIISLHGSRPATATPTMANPSSPRKSPPLSLSIPPDRAYPASSPPTTLSTSPPTATTPYTRSAHGPLHQGPRHPPSVGEFTAQHQLLLMRLKPLLTVEPALLRRLSLPDDIEGAEEGEATNDVEQGVPRGATTDNEQGRAIHTEKSNSNGTKSKTAKISPITRTLPRPRSLHETLDPKPIKSEPNLAGTSMRTTEKEGQGPANLIGDRNTNETDRNTNQIDRNIKAVSTPVRPRARSSVDISGVEGSGSTYRSSVPSPPPPGAPGPGPWPQLHPSSYYTTTRSTPGTGSGFTMHPSVSTSSLDLERHYSRTNPSSSRSAAVAVGEEPVIPIPEFFVQSTANWKEKLRKWKRGDPAFRSGPMGNGTGDAGAKNQGSDWNPWDEDEDPAHLIQACSRDVLGLWNDPAVREYLTRNRYKLEHLPGFFLSDVDRIVSRDYMPTDDDILRARLKTIGAVEHRFFIDGKSSVPRDWIVYDVGGARTQRAAWVPYFDAVDAIIFIVSLSSFDQTLSEDPSVNRMQDSLRSFRDLVGSKILKNVNIIVFLNKIDLLESKLNSGIQLVRYFKRYGDRPNNTTSVISYFTAKFTAIYEKYTPSHAKRVFSVHATALTDPQSSRMILEAVNESIIQMHLARCGSYY